MSMTALKPSEIEAIKLVTDLEAVCKLGLFRIVQFSSNNVSVLNAIPLVDRAKELQLRSLDYNDLPSERALGVFRNINDDSFTFSITVKDKPHTRRTVSSVYDPVGFTAPFILIAKQMLQYFCREEHLGWDDEVPDEYVTRWNDWLKQLPLPKDVHVSRYVRPIPLGAVVSTHSRTIDYFDRR